MTAWGGGGFEELACPQTGCEAVIVAHAATVAKWRRTGENFYCPRGHSACFNGGKSADQAEIDRLKLHLRLAREAREDYRQRLSTALRSCSWVGCSFIAADNGANWDRRALHTHMRRKHGMPTLAAVEAEAS